MSQAASGLQEYLNNLEEQLQEIEVLESMYPGANEFELGDPCIVHDIQQFLKHRGPEPTLVELTLRLQCEGSTIEVICNLPREYPASSLPQVYVRSQSLTRVSQARINRDVGQYLKDDLGPGEPCLLSVISWVLDKAEEYLVQDETLVSSPAEPPPPPQPDDQFARYWIYSHHIYSKIKRKDMLDMAREYDVTGFCLPGKPGIICIEGSGKNCSAWWSVVKNWNWKRLSLKLQEEEVGPVDSLRRFRGFCEIGEVKGASRDFHMDMGQFQNYLDEHGCAHIFPQLFGIEK